MADLSWMRVKRSLKQRTAVNEYLHGVCGRDSSIALSFSLCCTVRGDLARILHQLVETKKGAFDLVLIETTGLANPGPVLQTILTDDTLMAHYHLDGVVTLVDAVAASSSIQVEEETRHQQIAFADVILLNKVDMLDDETALVTKLRAINDVPIYPTRYGRIDLDRILGLGGFDLARMVAKDVKHGFMSVGIDMEGALDFDRLNRWIQSLLASMGPNIYRMKGILNVNGEQDRFIFQGVHMVSQCFCSSLSHSLSFHYSCLTDNRIGLGKTANLEIID